MLVRKNFQYSSVAGWCLLNDASCTVAVDGVQLLIC